MNDMPRAIRIGYEWLNGSTLQQIGENYGVTRERVRQIIKNLGLTGEFGGAKVKAFVNRTYVKKDPMKRFLPGLGCTKEEAIAINGSSNLHEKGAIARKYMSQRSIAKFRGVEWKFTFPEWWKVWQESGKWESRGRGTGYCMARIGDTGAYEVGNVEIKTIGENFSESYYKTPWHVRFPNGGFGKNAKKRADADTHCKHGHEYAVVGRYNNGACKLCTKIWCHKNYLDRKNKESK